MEVLTESYRNPDEHRVFGDTTIDLPGREVRGPNGVQRLEPRVVTLLGLLLQRPGAVVTREALIDGLSGDDAGSDEALSQTVARLRRALGDNPKAPRFIATVPKAGYRWIADPAAPVQRPRIAALASRYPRALAASLVIVLVTGMASAVGLTLLLKSPQRLELREVLITTRGGKTTTTTKTVTGPHATLEPLRLLTR